HAPTREKRQLQGAADLAIRAYQPAAFDAVAVVPDHVSNAVMVEITRGDYVPTGHVLHDGGALPGAIAHEPLGDEPVAALPQNVRVAVLVDVASPYRMPVGKERKLQPAGSNGIGH